MLADGTYQCHFLDISKRNDQISLQGMDDDMENGDLEEDEGIVDEEMVSAKTKKGCAQKMATRGLVEAQTQPSSHPGNGTELVVFHLFLSSQMLLLTETVLFYWDLFDASSPTKELGGSHYGQVRDWAQNNVKSRISGIRTNTSRVTPASRVTSSRVTSASKSQHSSFARSKSLGMKVKGSTKSSHSIATQPPATPASAVGQDLPISYFNEDDDVAEFTDPTQESAAKECDVSRSMVSDSELSCMT